MTAPSEALTRHFDAVYMLLFDGWKRDFRGNRWYWAKRWARLLPTYIVQPSLAEPTPEPRVEVEPRISGCSLVHVLRSGIPGHPVAEARVQTAQLAAHLARAGHERVLLWNYNPRLLGLFASIPAAFRVHHATENYYAFDALDDLFIRGVDGSIQAADLTICVSPGVAAGVADHVPSATTAVITNGCEFEAFASAQPDVTLVETGRDYERIAIYAGNINSRLDFALLLECARTFPQTLFAFYGRIDLDHEHMPSWRRLTESPNVRFMGEIDPDRIPSLYAASHVGLIPYTAAPLIVQNGFPLKALDMAASGLPVVSSDMEPIRGLSSGIHLAKTAGDFVNALRTADRRTLAPTARADLLSVAAANDYDRKFEQALAMIVPGLGHSAVTRLDAFTAAIGGDEWLAGCRQQGDSLPAPPSSPHRLHAAMRRRSSALASRLLGG